MVLPSVGRADPIGAEAFAISAKQEIAFLVQSSRLAAHLASDSALRALAASEIVEQQGAYDVLKELPIPGPAVAYATSLETATPKMDSATPLGADTVLTGRSVAIDENIGELRGNAPIVSPGVIIMSRLESASGPAFDAMLRKVQAAALKELAGLYAAYLREGDDPGLRALAAHNLPAVEARLKQIATP